MQSSDIKNIPDTSDYLDNYDEIDDFSSNEYSSHVLRARLADYLPFKKLSSSNERASHEWMSYYHLLYIKKSPDPVIFKRLLKRHGVWLLRNPFREGNEDFYAFNANGIFLADIDFLLDKWTTKYLASKSTFDKKDKSTGGSLDSTKISNKEKSQEDLLEERRVEEISIVMSKIQSNWEVLYQNRLEQLPGRSVEVTELNNLNEWRSKLKNWEIAAHKVLTILFLSDSKNWLWIKEELHKDNLTILMHILYDNAPLDQKTRLLNSWYSQKWLSEEQRETFASK